MLRSRWILTVVLTCGTLLFSSLARAQAPATPSDLGALTKAFLDAAEPKEAAAELEKALAAASPSTRAALAMESRRQMVADLQKQADLDAGSEEYRRLEERMDRLQATVSAAAGDLQPLRTVTGRALPPGPGSAPAAGPAAGTRPDDELGNLEEQLRSFRARLERLTTNALNLQGKLTRCLGDAASSFRSVLAARIELARQIDSITNQRNDLEELARAAAAAEQAVRANSAQAATHAKDAANLFAGAQAMAETCVTPADASALSARLDAIRAAFNLTITGMAESLRAVELYEKSVNGYDRLLPEYELARKSFADEKQRAIGLTQDVSRGVDEYLGLVGEVEELAGEADTVMADLDAAFSYYSKSEPVRAAEFSGMRNGAHELRLFLSGARETYNQLKGWPADARRRLEDLELPISITRGAITPRPVATDLHAITDQAEVEVGYLELLMVNESVLRQAAAVCGQLKPLDLLNVTPGGSPVSGPTPPPAPVPPPATPTPDPEIENGLLVLGLNRMVPGQFEQFTAADGFERPYVGPVEWNSSVEDVVTIDRRTGEAVAFKPGKTVIIARKGDMVAYFAVTVEAPPANPSAGDAASGGFENLGGETTEIVEPPVDPAPPADPVRDFFQGAQPEQTSSAPVAPPPDSIDPYAGQREEEQAREERRRQEQGEAMMNLMGILSGASQTMNDIRNQRRESTGGGYTPPQPQATWPTGPSAPIYQPPGGSPASTAPPAGGSSQSSPGVHTGQPGQPAASGCGRFPENWSYSRAWERMNGQMVPSRGRPSMLGNWAEVPCIPNTAYSDIVELTCRSTGEKRCLGHK